MHRVWRHRPFPIRKIEQLWRLVRESHERPMMGVARPVKVGDRETLGVTFIGHSSFLLQVHGRKLPIDPVFSTRLFLFRLPHTSSSMLQDIPPSFALLLT